MTLKDFQNWLDGYLNFEKSQKKGIFWLDSMKFLARKLGNPQDKIPCIHVAGSKGKGSVSSMIASILKEEGLNCGLYTSPHISDIRERIGTADGFFCDSVYDAASSVLVSAVTSIDEKEIPGGRKFTWFELVTLFSFLCFVEAKCDFAVYEVGLGGRLDSTNILKPRVSVITPIEKEHMEFLGNTIKKIAKEKAGIIKEGIPCVISRQIHKDAENVFLETCTERKSDALLVRKICSAQKILYTDGKMNLEFSSENEKIRTCMRLLGKKQAENAETAYVAVKTAFPKISLKSIEKGLSNAFIPGRFEIHGNIVMDGAHTVGSVSNAIRTIKEIFPDKEKLLLFSCAGDKNMKGMIKLFKGIFRKIVFTEPKSVRNSDSEKLLSIAKELKIEAEAMPDVREATETLKSQMKETDILLVAGSFYLVAEIKNGGII